MIGCGGGGSLKGGRGGSKGVWILDGNRKSLEMLARFAGRYSFTYLGTFSMETSLDVSFDLHR